MTPILGNVIVLPALIFGACIPRRRSYDPIVQGFAMACLVFFAWFAIRGLFALPDPGLERALSRISPFLFFGLVFWFRDPRAVIDIPVIWFAPAAGVVFVLVWGEASLNPAWHRTELLAGNPQFLAPAVLPLFYMNMWAASRALGWGRICHYGAAFLSLIVVVYFCGARAALMSVACLMVAHIIFTLRSGWLSVKQKITHLTIMGGTVVTGSLAAIFYGPTAAKFQILIAWIMGQGLQTERSISIRLEIWTGAVKALQNNPLFGYGPQNRYEAVRPYLPEVMQSVQVSNPHNVILTLAVGGGIIGVIVGIGMICSVVGLAWKHGYARRPEFELLVLGCITTLSFGMTNLVLFEGYIAIVTILTLITPLFLNLSQDTKG